MHPDQHRPVDNAINWARSGGTPERYESAGSQVKDPEWLYGAVYGLDDGRGATAVAKWVGGFISLTLRALSEAPFRHCLESITKTDLKKEFVKQWAAAVAAAHPGTSLLMMVLENAANGPAGRSVESAESVQSALPASDEFNVTAIPMSALVGTHKSPAEDLLAYLLNLDAFEGDVSGGRKATAFVMECGNDGVGGDMLLGSATALLLSAASKTYDVGGAAGGGATSSAFPYAFESAVAGSNVADVRTLVSGGTLSPRRMTRAVLSRLMVAKFDSGGASDEELVDIVTELAAPPGVDLLGLCQLLGQFVVSPSSRGAGTCSTLAKRVAGVRALLRAAVDKWPTLEQACTAADTGRMKWWCAVLSAWAYDNTALEYFLEGDEGAALLTDKVGGVTLLGAAAGSEVPFCEAQEDVVRCLVGRGADAMVETLSRRGPSTSPPEEVSPVTVALELKCLEVASILRACGGTCDTDPRSMDELLSMRLKAMETVATGTGRMVGVAVVGVDGRGSAADGAVDTLAHHIISLLEGFNFDGLASRTFSLAYSRGLFPIVDALIASGATPARYAVLMANQRHSPTHLAIYKRMWEYNDGVGLSWMVRDGEGLSEFRSIFKYATGVVAQAEPQDEESRQLLNLCDELVETACAICVRESVRTPELDAMMYLIAKQSDSLDVFEHVAQAQGRTISLEVALFAAAAAGNAVKVRELIAKGADPFSQHDDAEMGALWGRSLAARSPTIRASALGPGGMSEIYEEPGTPALSLAAAAGGRAAAQPSGTAQGSSLRSSSEGSAETEAALAPDTETNLPARPAPAAAPAGANLAKSVAPAAVAPDNSAASNRLAPPSTDPAGKSSAWGRFMGWLKKR